MAPAAYAVLTVALTWPIAARLTDALPNGSDGWQMMWGLWWVKRAVLELHTNPFHTDLLYYPYGVSLYFHPLELFNGLLSIPLQLAFGNLLTVYNLLALVAFLTSGWFTYLLVHHLTGARGAAFVAGIVFAFCPYHFAHLRGQLNLISYQWIPLYVLVLLKAWEQRDGRSSERAAGFALRGWGWWLLSGLLLAVNAYVDWSYLLLLGLFTVWFACWQVAVERRGPGVRAGAVGLGLLGGTAGVLIGPVLLPMLEEARNATYMRTSFASIVFFSSDLTDILVPSPLHPWWPLLGAPLDEHFRGRILAERVVTAGYTVLALAVAAAWIGRREAATRFWGWTAFGVWLFSLGPILQVWGRSDWGGTTIPLPYAALLTLPGFDVFRVPSRLMVLAMLALAVLVGRGLAGPWPRPVFGGRSVRRSVLVAVGGMILLEFLAAPYLMMELEDEGSFYHELAREPGRFGVLEIPMQPWAIYEAHQTLHGKPLIGGYLSRQPPDQFVASSAVLRYLLPTTGVDDPVGSVAASSGLDELRRANVRYAIVHERFMTSSQQAETTAKLQRVFLSIVPKSWPEDRLVVYSLGPG